MSAEVVAAGVLLQASKPLQQIRVQPLQACSAALLTGLAVACKVQSGKPGSKSQSCPLHNAPQSSHLVAGRAVSWPKIFTEQQM